MSNNYENTISYTDISDKLRLPFAWDIDVSVSTSWLISSLALLFLAFTLNKQNGRKYLTAGLITTATAVPFMYLSMTLGITDGLPHQTLDSLIPTFSMAMIGFYILRNQGIKWDAIKIPYAACHAICLLPLLGMLLTLIQPAIATPYLLIIAVLLFFSLLITMTLTRKIKGNLWLLSALTFGFLATCEHFLPSNIQLNHGMYEALSLSTFGLHLFSIWWVDNTGSDSFKALLSFSGRIPRAGFWLPSNILAVVLFTTLESYSSQSQYGDWNYLSYFMGLTITFGTLSILISTYIQRLHDLNKSAWWLLCLFIPIVGWIGAVIYLGFTRGRSGENFYGSPPLTR